MFYRTLQCYGDVLQPLVLGYLHPMLQAQLAASPRLMAWALLCDQVHRSEKVSSWTDWTPQEQAAYETGCTATFSRARGYTEAQIADFERYLAETRSLCAELGEDEVCGMAFEIGQATATLDSDRVMAELEELSVAGHRARRTTA